jgi:hypothetical protein
MPLSEFATKILDTLPKDGSMVGNAFLRKQLGMDASEFFRAKLELQQKGQVVTGKGRGGSIGLTKISGPSSMPDRGRGVKDEGALYKPIKDYFDDNWGPNYESPDYYCAVITGTPKGHKRRSGLWSRPDVSILTVTSYQFLPTKQIEVTTIEAKKYYDATPQAVFETASQSKFAHQSYLVIEWREETDLEDSDNVNVMRILNEARRFGIGIIQMKQNDHGGWDFREILDPQKRIPDPDECNTFIERAFRPHHKQILGALGKG